MEDNKYNREIKLLCPTCGCDQFEYENEENGFLKCHSCERMMLKDELINENAELINNGKLEIANKIKKDFERKIKKIFKGK